MRGNVSWCQEIQVFARWCKVVLTCSCVCGVFCVLGLLRCCVPCHVSGFLRGNGTERARSLVTVSAGSAPVPKESDHASCPPARLSRPPSAMTRKYTECVFSPCVTNSEPEQVQLQNSEADGSNALLPLDPTNLRLGPSPNFAKQKVEALNVRPWMCHLFCRTLL